MLRLRKGDNLTLKLQLIREGEKILTQDDLVNFTVSAEFVDANGNVVKTSTVSWDQGCSCWLVSVQVDDFVAQAVKMYVVFTDASGYRESSYPIELEVIE